MSQFLCSQGYLLSRFWSFPLGLHFGERRRTALDRPNSCPRHGDNTERYVICNTCLQMKSRFISKFIRFWQYKEKKRSVLVTQNISCDKVEKNGMGGECSAYVGEEKRMQSFGGET